MAEGVYEVMRIKMAILREPNSALRYDAGIGFEFVNAIEVADFSFQSQTMGGFGNFGFFVESLLRLAKHGVLFG